MHFWLLAFLFFAQDKPPQTSTLSGSVVSNATVLPIAEAKLRSRRDSFYEATTDQYGRYHVEGIRPGDYKLFAWDDLEPNSWFDPDFLKDVEGRGEAVTVTANGHGTVSLHLVGAK